MLQKYTFLLFALYCANGVLSSSLIAPCKVEDKACIQKSVTEASAKILKGIPALGIETSDPLFIEKIEGNLSILQYKFFNTTITGYSKCQVLNINLNKEFTSIHYELSCSDLKMVGQYEIDGRLIILPVEGKGDYELLTGKYKIEVESELKTSTGPDGKSRLAIKNFKLNCTPLTALHFDFRNLFNGQKDLSDAVHKFAHETWEDVAKLLQDPVFYAAMGKIIKNVNKYLKSVPLDEYKLN